MHYYSEALKKKHFLALFKYPWRSLISVMRNLIIISNLDKGDFVTKLPAIKEKVDQKDVLAWADIPFLRRCTIITKDEHTALELYNYLVAHVDDLDLKYNGIILKENYLNNVQEHDLKVDTAIDLHYENKVNKKPQVFTYAPQPNQLPSPTITINSFDE